MNILLLIKNYDDDDYYYYIEWGKFYLADDIYKYNKIFYSNVYKDFHNKQNNVLIVPQFIRLTGEINLQNDWFLVVSEFLVKITHTHKN